MGDRVRSPKTSAAVIGAAVLLLVGCEAVTVQRVNQHRATAGVPAVEVSAYLTEAARARASEMCADGAVTSTSDPVADYLGEPTSRLDELVGASALDPGIVDAGARNGSAGNELWEQWRNEATLTDPTWDAVGVGEHECGDGNLYSALVLRDDPPGLDEPADTSQIVPAETLVEDGWSWQRYRNLAYPCAIGGYHSFVVGTPVGSSPAETRPLWVRMRGGGVGWFDAAGAPQPGAGVKSEESLEVQLGFNNRGVMEDALAGGAGFRTLIVSMCSHDVYAGNDTYDPHNPNITPDGRSRPASGLTSTKAAVQFTRDLLPTDDMILHGTSGGAYGAFHVAWALQRQGIPPAGIVSDSGVANLAWQTAVASAGISGTPGCEQTTEERIAALQARFDPEITDPANQPHLLVADGRLEVPVMVVWNRSDKAICGEALIPCPLPDGSTPLLQAADCNFAPMRLAIDSLGDDTDSAYLRLCVVRPATSYPCDAHVLTTFPNGVNTDPSAPADYNAAVLEWVIDRLDD